MGCCYYGCVDMVRMSFALSSILLSLSTKHSYDNDDWQYSIGSVVQFLLIFFCFFRLINGLLPDALCCKLVYNVCFVCITFIFLITFTAQCSVIGHCLMQECENGEKIVVTSSYVWICMTGHRGTEVAVADANNLSCLLDRFHISSSHILCVAGVPGLYHMYCL